MGLAASGGAWSGEQPCSTLPTAACVQTGGVAPSLDQRFAMVRRRFGLTVGLPLGLQLGADVPIDVKHVGSSWSVAGTPLTPDWDGHTHADGTHVGVGDTRAWFGISDAPAGVGGLMLGVWVGASLPTGRPPRDPADRLHADARQREFGIGTVAPVLRTMLFYTSASVGFLAMAEARFVVHATPKGYRGPSSVVGSLGPTLMLPAPLQRLRLRMTIDLSALSQERWHGVAVADSGRAAVGVTMGASVQLHDRLTLDASMQTRAYEALRGNQFALPIAGTLQLTALLPAPKKRT